MQVEKAQRQVYVNMTNHTLAEMNCERYIDLNGSPTISPLPPIPAGEIIYMNNAVSKGFVVYVGRNKDHLPSAWLLAWDAPRSDIFPPPRKVYVACGSKSAIDKMTQDEIRKNLDESSNFSQVDDPNTKTTAYAGIIDASPDDSASVSSTFGLMD
ncbi:hypothetical protein vseg_014135 [Gypsophila vaccaria]